MNFHINNFEGPLDLLLHLIKESKMDIYEIKISQIIEQYLDIIHNIQNLDINIASSYLVMAAELLHLKSKLLLNQQDEEDLEEYEFNNEEDLRKKLIEYQKYKQVSEEFKQLNAKRQEVYTRVPSNLNDYQQEQNKINDKMSIEDLINAFLEFKKREILNKPMETKITRKELSIVERKNSIRKLLENKKKVNFKDLFENFTKEYIVVTFLSILDMSKNNEIILTQKNNFGNILIEKKV